MISALLQPGHAVGTIVDELTRRRLLGGGIGAAALLVAGCGSDDGTDASDAGVTGDAGTRTITDDAGDEVTVPARPQRIVSTWSYGAAVLLEAGAPVVGMPLSTEPLFEEDLAARHDLGDVADIGTVDALNIELVASLTPDLIVVALLGGEPTADDATLQLSLERVGDLSADLVVVYNLGDADLTAIDVFAALPANASGQVVVLPETHQAVTWTNYTALAEQLTEIIAAAAPLDPDVVPTAP